MNLLHVQIASVSEFLFQALLPKIKATVNGWCIENNEKIGERKNRHYR